MERIVGCGENESQRVVEPQCEPPRNGMNRRQKDRCSGCRPFCVLRLEAVVAEGSADERLEAVSAVTVLERPAGAAATCGARVSLPLCHFRSLLPL